ncbi:class I SAM-dependent methyltransferase [Phenylobacterium sp. J426]|uniref:class I SAM-dependent methyltransferase n=1 Tax=Phenylobacterium sp. J426 TaxID=2898439 RepID=UPI002150E859|nr:class I SAM-dependent methyltransferase [Phenylobacterium sp. J426]MCR5876369.1 class I SAM-dependent methyltransferase [Phenylobacterium sp. J426]
MSEAPPTAAPHAAPNAAQAAYWNESAGPTWASLQALLDRQLEPLGEAALRALAPAPGERILDIGCGAGATTARLAAAAAPDGEATGLDISRPLLEIARTRSAPGRMDFVEADAQTHVFPPGAYDAAFSRFGVMFFADPVAAFANIRLALRPGGRLVFICWRTPAENPIMTLPMAAASRIVEPPPPPEPGAPGPFAFADPNRVLDILGTAGFGAVEIARHDEKIGAGDLDAALELALRVGPLGGLLREHPDKREAVVEVVRDALAHHVGEDGVKLDSATWIVSARTLGS